MESLKDRFLRYVRIDTQSDPESTTYPSTPAQLAFLSMLKKELEEIGLSDVDMDSNGYVTATIPATISQSVPVIGFIAHVDTSPDLSGKNVNPRIIENYDGKDILLNKEGNILLTPAQFPELALYKGDTLIVTDGNTLLGADDKAGVAEIIDAAQYLIKNPHIKHGKIRIAFTPDEEIGRGVDFFNVKKFGADYAYTMDGGRKGELEYENFNAASARIEIQGNNVHPGYAKGKMLNALRAAMLIDGKLPAGECPENTEGREGFYHLTKISGSVDSALMEYIIRDHDRQKFEARKQCLTKAVEYVKTLGYGIDLQLRDQYYNMREIIEQGNMYIVERAEKAMEKLDIKPHISPVRGGTDGCRLSFMGLPCPNLFAGGENFHGRYEFISLQTMQKAKDLIVEIATQE